MLYTYRKWLFPSNHKDIGSMYIFFSILSGVLGVIASIVIRFELIEPGGFFFKENHQLYNSIVTLHGLIMVFFMITPILFNGFGNWFIPILIGAPNIAFPKVNNISFWLLVFAFFLLISSILIDGGAGTGWTFYPPLSSINSHPGVAVDIVIISLNFVAVSSLLSAINMIVTILNMRTSTITLFNMPLFVWSILITSFLLVLVMPVLISVITMLFMDRNFSTSFFNVDEGGDPLMFQHLFWFFAHPEVYIVILPGFGIISQVISTFSNKPIFGYLSMIWSMILIGFIGIIIWVHHMFSVGLSYNTLIYFTITTMIVAIPTGMKILSWIATMWGGSIEFKTPMLFCIGFIILFTIGGISGIILSNAALNRVLHDTYYVVAHLHYTMSLGALFSAFAGFYYWFSEIFGKSYPEFMGKVHFWLIFIGVNITFLPQHFLGLMGMPRRVPDYPDVFMHWNKLSSIGAFISAASLCYFLYLVYYSLKCKPKHTD